MNLPKNVGRRRRWLAVLRTIAAATVGGLVFHLAGFPAAWLAGSMVVVAVLTVAGYDTDVPRPLFIPASVILGISLGAGLGPDTLSLMAAWPVSLVALGLMIIAIMAGTYVYFRRVCGWRSDTAFYAGLPGALSVTIFLAMQSRAEMPRVAFAQSIRLLILVAVLPLIIVGTSEGPVAMAVPDTGTLTDMVILLIACTVVGFLFEWVRFPAGMLVGAMVASGVLHITGAVHGTAPAVILVPAIVILGAIIGSRFKGVSVEQARRDLAAGFGGFLVGIAFAIVFAAAVAGFLDIPFGHVLIAFAPGGLEAMAIMALTLGADPAFVGTHQLVRFVGLSLVMPFVARRLGFVKRAD